jgi:RNA-binding protein
VGRDGCTEGTQQALEALFAHHELVKVRVLPSAAVTAREAASAMADAARATLVGVVGHTFVLYRPNPELKERIVLE